MMSMIRANTAHAGVLGVCCANTSRVSAQPVSKSLASWHRHADLCVLPDRSVNGQLTAEQCGTLGGQFTALTQWMVHAWIWKDSPTGVFSATNPTVR